MHSPNDAVTVSPKKLPKPPSNDLQDQDVESKVTSIPVQSRSDVSGPLPSDSLTLGEPDVSRVPLEPVTPEKGKSTVVLPTLDTPSASQGKVDLDNGSMALFPEPFTPSINRTLHAKNLIGADDPAPLPDGLTVTSLKGRLNGKKIKCGRYCLE